MKKRKLLARIVNNPQSDFICRAFGAVTTCSYTRTSPPRRSASRRTLKSRGGVGVRTRQGGGGGAPHGIRLTKDDSRVSPSLFESRRGVGSGISAVRARSSSPRARRPEPPRRVPLARARARVTTMATATSPATAASRRCTWRTARRTAMVDPEHVTQLRRGSSSIPVQHPQNGCNHLPYKYLLRSRLDLTEPACRHASLCVCT